MAGSKRFYLFSCVLAIGLCFDGEPNQAHVRACDRAPLDSSPLCDTALSLKDRASYLVGQLTTQEKIALLSNGAHGVPRLGLASYQWWSEALHGVGLSPGVLFGGPTPCATSFPQVPFLCF